MPRVIIDEQHLISREIKRLECGGKDAWIRLRHTHRR